MLSIHPRSPVTSAALPVSLKRCSTLLPPKPTSTGSAAAAAAELGAAAGARSPAGRPLEAAEWPLAAAAAGTGAADEVPLAGARVGCCWGDLQHQRDSIIHTQACRLLCIAKLQRGGCVQFHCSTTSSLSRLSHAANARHHPKHTAC
jgi:hypothetical protein